MEYAAPIWNPFLKKDIKNLENVQYKATRILCIKGQDYDERLRKLKIPTLEERRQHGDLIQTFKIMNSIDKVNWHSALEFNDSAITRGHNKRIRRQLVKNSNVRHHFLTNRISETWNGLTQEIVDAVNVNSFKNKVDKKLFN